MENFTTLWMSDICTALNSAGLEMPKEKGGGKWSIDRFENSVQLMKEHVTRDIGIYEYLDSKGLINRGKCPITGESIGQEHNYQFFGRIVYISQEGKKIAQEWDRQEHIRLFGKEPMTQEQKEEAREKYIENHKRVPLVYWLILIALIALFIKKCV